MKKILLILSLFISCIGHAQYGNKQALIDTAANLRLAIDGITSTPAFNNLIKQNGNSFGGGISIGTNDPFGVNIRVGGVNRLVFGTDRLTTVNSAYFALSYATVSSGAGITRNTLDNVHVFHTQNNDTNSTGDLYRGLRGTDRVFWVDYRGNTFAPNLYTKTNLLTSGQAQVHWDNIINIPASPRMIIDITITSPKTSAEMDVLYPGEVPGTTVTAPNESVGNGKVFQKVATGAWVQWTITGI